jgi:hypothetical protein
VKRILSLKPDLSHALAVFPVLVNVIDAYFKDQTPDLGWITAK